MDWDFGLEDEESCLDLLAYAGFILIDSNKKIIYKQFRLLLYLLFWLEKVSD